MADKPLGARQMKEYYERGSGVNSSAAEASQRGPPAASLGPINTNFPRRFLCCLLPLPIQCMHKPKRELVNIFVEDTAHLRLRQVRLPFSSGFSYRREWDGFRKGVDLPEKRIFCIIKQGKKTREVTSPGPWPLIILSFLVKISKKKISLEIQTQILGSLFHFGSRVKF